MDIYPVMVVRMKQKKKRQKVIMIIEVILLQQISQNHGVKVTTLITLTTLINTITIITPITLILVACRNCEDDRANTFAWIVKASDLAIVDSAMNLEPTDDIRTSFLICSECNTVTFPLYDGRMTTYSDGIISCLPKGQENISSNHWELSHYMPNCDGRIQIMSILLSKGESKYGYKAVTTSPALPNNTAYIPGYVRPFNWITTTNNQSKAAMNSQDTRNLNLSLVKIGFQLPIWCNRAFVGQFGDCFVHNTELEGGHIASSIKVFQFTLQDIIEQHRDWLHLFSDDDISKVKYTSTLLQECASLSSKIAACKKPLLNEGLAAFLIYWRRKVEAMKPGDLLIFPGGFAAPKNAGSGHAVMHILERRMSDGEDSELPGFDFVLCNSGAGNDYHPARTDCFPKLKVRTSVRFTKLPYQRILDDAFWLIFWRMQVVSSADHHEHVLYELLYPYLAGQPLRHAFGPDEWSDYRTPQRAGLCYYKGITESVRYVLRRIGLTHAHTKQLSFAVRLAMLGYTQQDMLATSQLHDESHRTLVSMAGRQTAHAAVKEANLGRITIERLDDLCTQIKSIEEMSQNKPLIIPSIACLPPRVHFTDRCTWSPFPGFEALAADTSIQCFEGVENDPPPSPKLDLLQLPDSLSLTLGHDFKDVVDAMRTTLLLCESLSNQAPPRCYLEQLSLVQSLFVCILPVPQSTRCIWTPTGLLYAEQSEAIELLHRLAMVWTSSSFSITPKGGGDTTFSTSVVVMTCILAALDTVIRIPAIDNPSPVNILLFV